MLTIIPNFLTILRIILVPTVLYLFSIQHNHLAFILLIISCITDFLDGYLARALNATTKFGEIMDPMADKLFIISTFLFILMHYPMSTWTSTIIILLISREVLIMIWRKIIFFIQTEHVSVNNVGKIKITFEMSYCLIFFTNLTYIQSHVIETISYITLCLALFFSFYSAYLYISQNLPFNKSKT